MRRINTPPAFFGLSEQLEGHGQASVTRAGAALYSLIRGIVAVVIAYVLGSFLFGINPFQGQLALALVFILIGAVPLYGMTLIYGALVLRVKQANSLVNLMQWIVSFLMGVFFPITILPAFLRTLALLFPPTWMTNGARAAISTLATS